MIAKKPLCVRETGLILLSVMQALNNNWVVQTGWYGVPSRLIPADYANATTFSAYSRISSTFVTTLQLEDFPL
jgi:hypothetical protein